MSEDELGQHLARALVLREEILRRIRFNAAAYPDGAWNGHKTCQRHGDYLASAGDCPVCAGVQKRQRGRPRRGHSGTEVEAVLRRHLPAGPVDELGLPERDYFDEPPS